MARRRTAERIEDERGVTHLFRGSEYGGCPHGHWMSFAGAMPSEPEAYLQEVFRRGHAGEERVKGYLHRLGLTVHHGSSDHREQLKVNLDRWLSLDEKLRISCSLDGVIEAEDVEALLALRPMMRGDAWGGRRDAMEIKCFAPGPLAEFTDCGLHTPGKFELYKWQVSAGCHAFRRYEEMHGRSSHKPGLMLIASRRWNAREEAEMSEEQIATTPLVIWRYDEPPYSEAECLDRAQFHVDAWKSGKCPPCKSDYPCRYAAPEVACTTLERLSSAALEAQDQLNYWTQVRDARAEELLEAMRVANETQFTREGVTYSVAGGGKKITFKRSV